MCQIDWAAAREWLMVLGSLFAAAFTAVAAIAAVCSARSSAASAEAAMRSRLLDEILRVSNEAALWSETISDQWRVAKGKDEYLSDADYTILVSELEYDAAACRNVETRLGQVYQRLKSHGSAADAENALRSEKLSLSEAVKVSYNRQKVLKSHGYDVDVMSLKLDAVLPV